MHNRKDKSEKINSQLAIARTNNGFDYELLVWHQGELIKVDLNELELESIKTAIEDLLYFD